MTSTGKKILLIVVGIIVLVVIAMVETRANPEQDSTRSSWVINSRIHSAGYFPFTGALLNQNPVADVNVFFSQERWGFFVFQSFDLKDRHSYANYLQPGVFATVMATPGVRLRAFVGYVFDQSQGFHGAGSDYYTAGQLNWTLPGNLRLENTLLYFDLTTGHKLANRLLLEWSLRKFRAGIYVWQRTVLTEHFNSTSAALTLTVPIRITKKVSVECGASYMGYLSKTKPDYALQKGAIFTLAVPIEF